MVLETVRRLFGAIRPPQVRNTFAAEPQGVTVSVMTLASAMSPAEALQALTQYIDLPAAARVVVVPSVASRPGAGAHPHVIAALLNRLCGRATLGLPTGTPLPIRRRWEQLAVERGAQFAILGSAGWDRVTLPDVGFMLDEVYLPAEVTDASARIFVPALGDSTMALGFARQIAHPHTRMRARGSDKRTHLDVEVAAALRANYLLDASRLTGIAANLCFWTTDALSAELAGIAVQRLMDVTRGYESVSTWERQRVQVATEIGIGPAGGTDIVLRAPRQGPGLEPVVTFLRDELGCKVERVNGEGE